MCSGKEWRLGWIWTHTTSLKARCASCDNAGDKTCAYLGRAAAGPPAAGRAADAAAAAARWPATVVAPSGANSQLTEAYPCRCRYRCRCQSRCQCQCQCQRQCRVPVSDPAVAVRSAPGAAKMPRTSAPDPVSAAWWPPHDPVYRVRRWQCHRCSASAPGPDQCESNAQQCTLWMDGMEWQVG